MRLPSKTVRVGTLLVLLGVVALWALGRTNARHARSAWIRPVSVAVLVLSPTDEAAASERGAAGGVAGLRDLLEALAARLGAERTRHDPASTGPVFTFEVLGPLRPERLPPTDPPDQGPVARLLHAFDLWRATRAAHRAAPDFLPAAWDVRIYLVAAPGSARFAEGLGDLGGEIGIVRASLGDGDALLAATAVLHEALHCLGATDKYDVAGHALVPAGLAEPTRSPRYPQRLAEIMVGEVPLGPGVGRLPASAAEVGLGPITATEIGWQVVAP